MARLDDGFSTLILFDLDPNVSLWEKTVTPPGWDGGGEIDTTTMRNEFYRTRSPKSLVTLTNSTLVCAYDPIAYNEIFFMLNLNQIITMQFPDGQVLQFWGWLNLFQPNEHKEGEQPTAQVVIIPSNQNAGGVETGPSVA